MEPRQVHVPPSLPARELLNLVHSFEYVNAFCGGSLGGSSLSRATPSLLKMVLHSRHLPADPALPAQLQMSSACGGLDLGRRPAARC